MIEKKGVCRHGAFSELKLAAASEQYEVIQIPMCGCACWRRMGL
jgi:hypothetical protein